MSILRRPILSPHGPPGYAAAMDFATPQQIIARQAEMLANRVAKNYHKLAPAFRQQQIDCFRLYDRDIPEIRAVVDHYAGHLVVAEFTRTQTAELPGWLEAMAQAVGQKLGIPPEQIHTRQRRTRPEAGSRYRRLDTTGKRLAVRERDLQFLVNLDDFLDTGLFSDHRDTRKIVRGSCAGDDVLNLFCYTGAFTVAAAVGGARSSDSVDVSGPYLDWLADNLRLNGQDLGPHRRHQIEADAFLEWAEKQGKTWDLAIVDPPSFSQRRTGSDWDVQRDHADLLRRVLARLRPGGVLWFSTNHQQFQPNFDDLPAVVEDWTARSIPPDFRNRAVHRLWRLQVPVE